MTSIDEAFEDWVELHQSVTSDEHFSDRVMARIREHSERGPQERFKLWVAQLPRPAWARVGLVAACVALGALRLVLITRVLFG